MGGPPMNCVLLRTWVGRPCHARTPMHSILLNNSYGKSAVRLTKVVRNGRVHELFEIEAAVKLEGAFEPAYRDGNNRDVVATDTIRNTVYVLAKQWTFTT